MVGYGTTNTTTNNGGNTIAEREAELVALQSAFDEYIASSRELEEELDAELAKMRTSIYVVVDTCTGRCLIASIYIYLCIKENCNF